MAEGSQVEENGRWKRIRSKGGREVNQRTDDGNDLDDDVQLKTSSFAGRRVVVRNQARAVRASRVAIVAAAVRLNRTLQLPNPSGPTKTRRVETLTRNDRP
mmetsp:Transcript_2274/g.15154  ORF Transcript_2274/g.15154 Transcript_2274/m.15154 type:complete len:101 (+) Transcript_2274:188-490(+)